MQYLLAKEKDLNSIYELVQGTIKEIYKKYYTEEVVEFFCMHHRLENIKSDILANRVYILFDNNLLIGTATVLDNHINRFFISPNYQNKGYGSILMQYCENIISNSYDNIILDSSLAANIFYEKRGYSVIKHDSIKVNNDKYLVYEIMEKKLYKANSIINYNDRSFTAKMNSENGEVSNKTIFDYHQRNNVLWAEYFGGDIINGNIIGTVSENGELDFYYHHININNELRVGKCHSIPHIINDQFIELHESWQWLNGDLSKGESILIEIDDSKKSRDLK